MPLGRKMVFDLICRGCGACEQRHWDPTEAISVTTCPSCDHGMTVIGIDFPKDAPPGELTRLMEMIQGAGIVPLAVERHGRRPRAADPTAAEPAA